MDPATCRVLVVDDEEQIRTLVTTILAKLGYPCEKADDGFEALKKMEENSFDAVITDIKMPGMDGITLTREITQKHRSVPVMVLTGYNDEGSAESAISAGAREFMKKPFSFSEFMVRFPKMIRDSEIHNELEMQKEEKDIKSLKEELQVIVKTL